MDLGARRSIQRFVVTGQLGSGGTATVFRARDPQLERDVAIKVVAAEQPPRELTEHRTIDLRGRPPVSSDELLSEARIMARLSHPNVLPVYEVGLDEGAVFLVMEYIAGCNLRAWLAVPRGLQQILDLLAQAGRGLAAAHAAGIVHRDFKPENVLVGDDGGVRVADFGLSRIVRSTGSMTRIAEDRGTPEYMAPELWRGERATMKSDIYAFCTALGEALIGVRLERAALPQALRERGAPPALADALCRGLADDPRQRPELTEVLAAMAGRRSWPRGRTIAAGAVAAIAVGSAVAYAASSPGSPLCSDDPQRFAGRWDTARHAELSRALARRSSATSADDAARLAAMLDSHVRDIEQVRRQTCDAWQRDELTEPQLEIRASCLDRRGFELGGIVHRLIASTSIDLTAAVDQLQSFASPRGCADIVASPVRDAGAAAALYDRFLMTAEDRPDDQIRALGDVERNAATLGESELEGRVAFALGTRLRLADQLARSDEALERAYRQAIAIHSDGLAAEVLAERSTVARLNVNANGARDLAKLALEIARKPSVPIRTTGRVFVAIERAEHARGNEAAAIDIAQQGLDLITQRGEHIASTEAELQLDIALAMANTPGRISEAVTRARAGVELARTTLGEHDPDTAYALNVLAAALHIQGDIEASLSVRRRALAVLQQIRQPGSAALVMLRVNLASDLLALGEFEEARRECATALEQCARNEALRIHKPTVIAYLAEATSGLGRVEEGASLQEQAVEESTSQNGKAHRRTLLFHRNLVDYDLELGRLDDADRDIAAIDRAYRASPRPDITETTFHGSLVAQLALARGRPAEAERLARRALDEVARLPENQGSRGVILRALGSSLIAQRRFAEAEPVLTEALAIARRSKPRADQSAIYEIALAHAEAGLGKRGDAIARARAARDVLAHYPGQPRARREVAELLARIDPSSRPGRARP